MTFHDTGAMPAPAKRPLQEEIRTMLPSNLLHAAIQLDQEPLRQLVIGLDGTRSLLEFQHLFTSQQALLEQIAWLHRAVLIES